jgi:NAD-dependent deacetylase
LLGHPSLNNAAYWHRTEDPTPRLVVFSGAGLSHESGLSLFRGSDGLWDNHRVEEVCDANTWRQFRSKVDAFYERRLLESNQAIPHAGHQWCADQERNGAVLLTQNVDNLLQRAGASHVGHLHGRLDHRRCFACDFRWHRPEGSTIDDARSCPFCQSDDTRVAVVLFHEPAIAYESARRVLGGIRAQDVLMVVGTTAQVINPLNFLTLRSQVWIVDPNPSPVLLNYPEVRVFRLPASELPGEPGAAWDAYRTLSFEHS